MNDRLPFAALSLLAVACQSSDPYTVATFNGGEVRLADVESAILALPADERLIREAKIEQTYEEIAREIALTRTLLSPTTTREERFKQWREGTPRIFAQAVIGIFVQEKLGATQPVSEEELQLFYDQNSDQFSREERIRVFHLFKRASRPAMESAVREKLVVLRDEIRAGRSFVDAVQEHSESENRAADGQLGWVERGDFTPDLERLVFSLNAGEVSDPFAVDGGLALFFVSERVPESRMTFAEAKPTLRQQLATKKRKQRMAELVSRFPVPDDSVILDQARFAPTFRSKAPLTQELALIGDFSATRADVLNAVKKRRVTPWTAYRELVDAGLTYHAALKTDILSRRAEELERMLGATAQRVLLDARLREQVTSAKDFEKRVQSHYESHRNRFMTPRTFMMKRLSVSVQGDPVVQARQFETWIERVKAEEVSLEDAAKSLGGSLESLGPFTVDQLRRSPGKESRLVLALGAPGFTPVFNLSGMLRVVQITAVNAEQPRPFEQVKGMVQADLLRTDRALFETAIQQHLDAIRYRFYPERVKAVFDGMSLPEKLPVEN
ncbi:MAG: peptidyl-prolyl cis-trans isomerase [Myxococcota bacterium]